MLLSEMEIAITTRLFSRTKLHSFTLLDYKGFQNISGKTTSKRIKNS